MHSCDLGGHIRVLVNFRKPLLDRTIYCSADDVIVAMSPRIAITRSSVLQRYRWRSSVLQRYRSITLSGSKDGIAARSVCIDFECMAYGLIQDCHQKLQAGGNVKQKWTASRTITFGRAPMRQAVKLQERLNKSNHSRPLMVALFCIAA